MGKSKIKIGDAKLNYQGVRMMVTQWFDCNHLTVTFEDGCVRKITSCGNARWNKGNIRSYNYPEVYGKGYLGGNYYNTKKDKFIYKAWNHMLERCYTEKYHQLFPTYIGCEVCEEWLNFQNFAQWYYNNLWLNLKDSKLDKDILFKHNKIYSPQTCVIVDNRINCLFTKNDKSRGDLPIGVTEDCRTHSIRAFLYNTQGKRTTKYVNPSTNNRELDIQIAFDWYKTNKEGYIQQIANEYMIKYPNFPQRLYDAMCNYQVEITD